VGWGRAARQEKRDKYRYEVECVTDVPIGCILNNYPKVPKVRVRVIAPGGRGCKKNCQGSTVAALVLLEKRGVPDITEKNSQKNHAKHTKKNKLEVLLKSIKTLFENSV
jgi:hypothetical protein